MASEQDSNELLKTHDAAHLTQPGRGYLKVGQNEVYELFQSGYAGVPYDPETVVAETVDERIYKINDLGQVELVYDPGEEVVQGQDASDLPTQLEAVISEVNRVFESSTLVIPAKPWLPNLETRLVTPEVVQGEERNLKVPLGLVDIPSEQAQKTYEFDLEARSHTAIFSSPGYGKSTTLQTIAMNLARQNTPEQVQFYLLDFGTNGLLPLKDLPHVVDIVTLDEAEKLEKMLVLLQNLLETRKKEFQKNNVTDSHQFERKMDTVLPVSIVVLDSYDALADDKRKEKIDILMTQILREGAALGVYLLLSANRSGAINNRMRTNIESNLVLNLTDEMEVQAILGEKGLESSSFSGRGQLTVGEAITAIQIYLALESENEADYIENLIKECVSMSECWAGKRPTKVPILSNPFTYKDIEIENLYESLILGYSQETTLPYLWDLNKLPLLLVTLDTEEQGYVLLEFLLRQFKRQKRKTVLVDVTGEYAAYAPQFDEYLSEDELYSLRTLLLEKPVQGLSTELSKQAVKPFEISFDLMADFDLTDNAEVNSEIEIESAEDIQVPEEMAIPQPAEFEASEIKEVEDRIYYFSDLESVFLSLRLNQQEMKTLMSQHDKHFIFVAFNSFIAPSFDESIKYLRAKNKIGLFGVTRGEQKQVPITGYLGNEGYLDVNEFYAYQGRKYEKIRVPMEEEK